MTEDLSSPANGNVITPTFGKGSKELPNPGPPEKSGELVAMKHIDLETVQETVRVMRLIGDKSLLDKYNRNPAP